MNYKHNLMLAGEKCARAAALSSQADSERDLAIRQASYHGRLSVREISAAVGISHQRVAQVIRTNPIGPERLTLHDAMVVALEEEETDWAPVSEVAQIVAERALYTRKDGLPVTSSQIRARAAKHPELFEGTRDGTNRIRRARPRHSRG